jgi:hypothetical protein
VVVCSSLLLFPAILGCARTDPPPKPLSRFAEPALITTIPLIEGWDETYENKDIVSPKDRELYFGQFDHVRYFGRDFRDRVKSAEFTLQEFVGSNDECVRYGLIRGERVFVARRHQT